jgi:hypothetical protein
MSCLSGTPLALAHSLASVMRESGNSIVVFMLTTIYDNMGVWVAIEERADWSASARQTRSRATKLSIRVASKSPAPTGRKIMAQCVSAGARQTIPEPQRGDSKLRDLTSTSRSPERRKRNSTSPWQNLTT